MINMKIKLKIIQKIILSGILCFCISCSSEPQSQATEIETLNTPFKIINETITKNGVVVSFKGVNTLQTYGLGNPELMNEWNIQIIREFIGNLREQPISGNAILASDEVWYHPLQTIIDQNRANNKITILCPFGWVNQSGERTLLTGLNPSEQDFFVDYKIKMKQIAAHFKDQPDVWIEVWNEPYSWNNEQYTHDLWLSDMQEMVSNLRAVPGFESIIVVPGNEQGQSELAILEKGSELIEYNYNILFDLHAYEKWLLETTQTDITTRISRLKNQKIAFIFGEIGVQNVGGIMPVQHLLNSANQTNISVLAWLWNQNTEDNNALLTDDGLPNATEQNNFWGDTYRVFLNQ
jgi:mannan endo-1,4-beta-mannosidase